MCIYNRLLALIFRILLLLGCGIGLYLNSGIPNGELATYMLVFYTIQSNILCFIYFSILLFQNISDLKNLGIEGTVKIFPRLKGAVTMTIAVTFLVYHFILAPIFLSQDQNYSLFSWQNIMVHYFVPIMTILDWILFDQKSSFRWFDPIIWLSLPLTYFAFIIIRAKIGGVIAVVKSNYPYFFIDVDLIGWLMVLKNAGILILGFLILGYMIYVIDNISLERLKPILNQVKTSLNIF